MLELQCEYSYHVYNVVSAPSAYLSDAPYVLQQTVSSANNVNIANMWLGKALYYVGAVALLLGMYAFALHLRLHR